MSALALALSSLTAYAQLVPVEPTFEFGPALPPVHNLDFPLPPRTTVPIFDINGTYTGGGNSPFTQIVSLCRGTLPGQEVERERLHQQIPGADDFFAYHCALFSDAEARHSAALPGDTVLLLAQQQASLVFSALILETQLILNQMQAGGGAPEPRNERLAEIMRIRLLGEEVPRRPSLTLTHLPAGTPDGRPVDVPMSATIEAATQAFRRTRFTADVDDGVEAVRFSAAGAEVRVVEPVGCGAEDCVVPVSGGNTWITYEFLDPHVATRDLLIPVTLEVAASALFEGTWLEPVLDATSFDFAMCSRHFADDLSTSSVVADVRPRLFDATLSVPDLPGRRLTEGPEYASSPNSDWSSVLHPGDIDDLAPDPRTQSFAEALDEVVEGRATDTYLAARSDATGGLHDAIAAIDSYRGQTRCFQSESSFALAEMDAELATLEAGLARWEARFVSAESGAYTWRLRVEHGLALFDAGRPNEPVHTHPSVLAALVNLGIDNQVFLATNGIGAVFGHFLTEAAGAATAGKMLIPVAVYSAITETVRVVDAIANLETLFDLRSEIDEALGWAEMTAYFRIMRDRYREAHRDLLVARNRLEEIRLRDCICWQQPAPGMGANGTSKSLTQLR